MMKGKRLLSVILMLVMTVSLLTGITVNAAAPMQFEGATTVLFDQSFGGIKNAAGAPDFTISGTWVYADHFMMSSPSGDAYVQTRDAVDLSNASGFEFEVKMECTHNGNTIHMPGDYTVQWHNNSGAIVSGKSKVLALKKGSEVLAYTTVEIYDADSVYTIKYLEGKWTVTLTTKTKNVSFTYDDASKPTFNGRFKAQANSTGHFTMYYMKLTKFANTATVNHWKYDKTFTNADTLDTLKDEGFTFSNNDFTVSTSGIKAVHNDRELTFRPYGKDFAGSYYFETAIGRSMNYYSLDFNHSANGYYRIRIPKASTDNNIYLYKYDAATGKTHTLAKQAFTNNTNSITTTYKVKVENAADGSIKVTVDAVYGSTVIPTFTYTDTASDTVAVTTTTTDSETGETVETTENVDTGAPLTSGKIRVIWGYCGDNSYFKYLNAHSIVTDADKVTAKPVTYSDVVIDKTFTSADTVTSLANEGITAPSVTIDDSGIHSADKAVTYTGALGDDYSFSARMYRQWNNSEIRFGYNGSDYYSVTSHYGSASNKYIRITRSGTTIAENEIASGTSDTNKYGYCNWSTYDVAVTTDKDTGAKTIVLTFDCAGNVTTIKAVDQTPITSGTNVNMYANSSGIVSDFALTKYADSYEETVIDKTFSSADTKDSAVAEGFTFNKGGTTYTDDKGCTTTNMVYTHDSALKGSYKLHVEAYRTNNDINVYFGSDGTNYYQLRSYYGSASNNHFRLYKVYNGTRYVLYTSSIGYYESGRTSIWTDIDIDVTKLNDGSLKIDVSFVNKHISKVISYTDSATDTVNQTANSSHALTTHETAVNTGDPITTGTRVQVTQGGTGYVREFGLSKISTSTWFDDAGQPMYSANFYGPQGGILTPVKGTIYFEYPVARLGNYKAIATLHENNEMTGIKVISPVELYAGKVKLFTVTDAANAKVRVYFFDGEETLNRITEVYELN